MRVRPLLAMLVIVVAATVSFAQDSHVVRKGDTLWGIARKYHVSVTGPTFASEIAAGLPAAIVLAGRDEETCKAAQAGLATVHFRIYTTDDVLGVLLGGALKNVIAIAAGVVESLGLGHNALAALITRGLAEMSRLAFALGGRRDTLAGLSGLGDLVLTCTGALSRNRRVGHELGQGRPLADVLAGMTMVAEGVRTTHAALALGERHGIELPITQKMDEVGLSRLPALGGSGACVCAAVRDITERKEAEAISAVSAA